MRGQERGGGFNNRHSVGSTEVAQQMVKRCIPRAAQANEARRPLR
jgi:hypothetical protein